MVIEDRIIIMSGRGKGGELTEKEHKRNFYSDKNIVNIDLEGDYTLYTEDLFALLNVIS